MRGIPGRIIFVFFLLCGLVLLYLTAVVECRMGAVPFCPIANAVNWLLGWPPETPGPGMCPTDASSSYLPQVLAVVWATVQ